MSESKHTTERLQRWRTEDLKLDFVETLNKVEEFGWQTWSVFGESIADNFAYTVGVFDTLGLPELITIGLPTQTGASLLNRAVARMRAGTDLTQGRFRDIVGEVEVEFHPIDPKWLHRIMLRTDWYYEGIDVPVLQLVYPDLENRFQWHMESDDRFKQPMLLPGYPESDLERELWDSHDMSFDKQAWKFSDPPSTPVMTTEEVESKIEPITYVAHFAEDDAWMFLGPSMMEGRATTSRLRRMVATDKSIEHLADLPLDWVAVRDSQDKPWERFPDEDDEE